MFFFYILNKRFILVIIFQYGQVCLTFFFLLLSSIPLCEYAIIYLSSHPPFFWPYHEACRIIVPQPETELEPWQ